MAVYARKSEFLVLNARGREHDSGLEGAILFELLSPILDSLSSLSEVHEQAVRRALGVDETPQRGDRLAPSVAVLKLLSNVSGRAPMLMVIDDSHWIDKMSREVLSFVTLHLRKKPIVFAFGLERRSNAGQFEDELSEVRLGPIPRVEAGRLLDSLPNRPRGRARHAVLENAAGNPSALIEFARIVSTEGNALHSAFAGPLPLSPRLLEIVRQPVGLSKIVRNALLTLTVVEDADRTPEVMSMLARSAGIEGAERLGLISTGDVGPRFCSPLLRSAVYHSSTSAERAAAHQRLAELLVRRPDRQAWHLSVAQPLSQDDVADVLECTADIALSQNGPVAAACTLERAAELATSAERRSSRYVMSAQQALRVGEAEWAFTLAGNALALPATTEVQFAARRCSGDALLQATQYSNATSVLCSLAVDASLERSEAAFEAVGLAATAQLHSGRSRDREEVVDALEVIARYNSPTDPSDLANLKVLWARVGTFSLSSRRDAVQRLREFSDRPVAERSLEPMALSAWILDETDLAINLCRTSWPVVGPTNARAINLTLAEVLGWSCVDSGRWDEALSIGHVIYESYALPDRSSTATSLKLVVAMIHAMRGDSIQSRTVARSVLNISDPVDARSAHARARHVLGLAALSEKNFELAHAHLKKLFEVDGAPLHQQWSYLAIGDLAYAACRAGRNEEVSALVERALSKMDRTSSPRIDQIFLRARALCADGESAEGYFDKGLSDQEGRQWPFERAQLTLNYAEWLRRRRRINEAKALLLDSLDSFQQLGATPWAERAEAELRACGSAIAVRTAGLEELTPQERETVLLASKGLTNREIGEMMFISARTVGSHLYRLFPKLGVSSRQQLRDFAEAVLQDGGGPGAR